MPNRKVQQGRDPHEHSTQHTPDLRTHANFDTTPFAKRPFAHQAPSLNCGDAAQRPPSTSMTTRRSEGDAEPACSKPTNGSKLAARLFNTTGRSVGRRRSPSSTVVERLPSSPPTSASWLVGRSAGRPVERVSFETPNPGDGRPNPGILDAVWPFSGASSKGRRPKSPSSARSVHDSRSQFRRRSRGPLSR